MGSKPYPKFPKTCIEDRISGLPDAIVCHILSFVPTRDAVRTCVLSHRWKNVWASVPNVDFNVSNPEIDSGRSAGIVDRVLLFRGSSTIHGFNLTCCGIEGLFDRIDAWIYTAVRRNVVEVNLDLFAFDSPSNHLELPRSLFMCKTLEVMKLRLLGDVVASAPTSNCFPSLKYLHVTFHDPKVVDPLEKLFSCCPVLEDLIVEGRLSIPDEGSILNIIVSAPKLKRLQMGLYAVVDYPYKSSITADVPNLEYIELSDTILENYSLKNVKSLKKAKIDCGIHGKNRFAEADRIHRLFAEIVNVKYLSVSAPVLGDPDIEYRCSLPTFNNLNHLELFFSTCCSWKSLTNMLKISPNLEHLVFENNTVCHDHDEDELVPDWCPPEVVPFCLPSCLKTVCIRGFKGQPDEVKVAEYLLTYCMVLRKLTVYTRDFNEILVTKLWKKFSKFPRGSSTCQIKWIL